MRRVEFDPSKLTGAQAEWWKKWQQRADNATVNAIDAWERGDDIAFNEAIWKDLKVWLRDNVFHRKCAYCERMAVRDPDHAEHFRPKGAVTTFDPPSGEWIQVTVEWPDGKLRPHPGYFWLAYHWKNLLPSCNDCNSGLGKQNRFPLDANGRHVLLPKLSADDAAKVAAAARASVKWKQRYYLDPDALDAIEQRALLNPYIDEPRKYLRFGEGGLVAAIDDNARGKECIRVFQLDADPLRIERQKAQTQAELAYRTSLAGLILRKPPVPPETAVTTAYDEALAPYESGQEEYSAAAIDYVDIVVKEFKAAYEGGGR